LKAFVASWSLQKGSKIEPQKKLFLTLPIWGHADFEQSSYFKMKTANVMVASRAGRKWS